MEFYAGYETKWDKRFKLVGSKLGTTTNPFGANQLEELGKKLNTGVNNVELGTLKVKDFETLPLEHFREMRRLSEFTGVNPSFHAPIDFDLAGFDEKHWSEQKRRETEVHLSSVLDRTALLKRRDGLDVPVVVHASNVPLRQFEKGLKVQEGIMMDEDGNLVQKLKEAGDWGMRVMGVVNQDTGEVQHLQHSEKYRLGIKDKEVWDVNRALNNLNENKWHDEQLDLFSLQHDIADREGKIVEANKKILELQMKNDALEKTGLVDLEDYRKVIECNNSQAQGLMQDIENLGNQVERMDVKLHSRIDDLANKFRAFGNSTTQQRFDKFLNTFSTVDKEKEGLRKEFVDLHRRTDLSDDEKQKMELDLTKRFRDLISTERKVLTAGIAEMDAPKMWKPMTDFGLDKSANTVANAVFNTFKEHGNDTPFISIENAWLETGFSRGNELRELVNKSREKLVERLVREQGFNETDAKKVSERLIGATWDVGHINALRKAGYSEEEIKKFVLKETEEIAKGGKHVKHIHVTDNFGFEDSHLPPGMGNVPIKEILEKMEREGVLRNARVIEESGGFINAFKKESFPFTMTEFGSPIYHGGPRYEMDIANPYSPSFVEFPQKHFDLYGSGFSTLPTSVGGEVSGSSSRFSKTPNQ